MRATNERERANELAEYKKHVIEVLAGIERTAKAEREAATEQARECREKGLASAEAERLQEACFQNGKAWSVREAIDQLLDEMISASVARTRELPKPTRVVEVRG